MRLRKIVPSWILPVVFAGAIHSWIFLPLRHANSSELVRIRGLSSISESQAEEWIRNQLTFIDSSGVSMARADDVAYFLETAMRDRGYQEASVDWKIEKENEREIILLDVSEGNPLLVRNFAISGNTALEDAARA